MNSLLGSPVVEKAAAIVREIASLPLEDKIECLNEIRRGLHEISPFKDEPVDCVLWIKSDEVEANDYNPNAVAPPEMKLLEHSITQDGYTQPIVAWQRNGVFEVVDGFHRNRVGRESKKVRERIRGYLPVTIVKESRLDRGDRIASTIRHNRARGKHQVQAMSDIVIELKRRNWSDDRIANELGMDADEILRLTQITGLAEMFTNQQFSEAWEIEKVEDTLGSEILSEEQIASEKPDNGRILHTWDKWECYQAGFYEEHPPNGMSQEDGEVAYAKFLSDSKDFRKALAHIITKWTHSCEHYLTNERMNRIAWLGQAAVAHALRIPSCCRAGYHRLSEKQKLEADNLALKYLNKWLAKHGRKELKLDEAQSKTEMDLY